MTNRSATMRRIRACVFVSLALVGCKHSESALKTFPCDVEEVSVDEGPPMEVKVEVPRGSVVTVKKVGDEGTGVAVNEAGEVKIPVDANTTGIVLEYEDTTTGKFYRKTISKAVYD